MILPAKNEKDLVDVTDPVKKALEFHFVDEVDQVLDLAFGDALKNLPRVEVPEESDGKPFDGSISVPLAEDNDDDTDPHTRQL